MSRTRKAHDRVYGPPADCDDAAYRSWWIRHLAWRRALVSAAAYSNNAEETLAFFAFGNDTENLYPKRPLMPAPSRPAGTSEFCADEKTVVDQPPGRIRLLCPSCQSADVLRDAYAKWSVDEQAWALAEVFDFMVCEACEMEVRNLQEVRDDAGA